MKKLLIALALLFSVAAHATLPSVSFTPSVGSLPTASKGATCGGSNYNYTCTYGTVHIVLIGGDETIQWPVSWPVRITGRTTGYTYLGGGHWAVSPTTLCQRLAPTCIAYWIGGLSFVGWNDTGGRNITATFHDSTNGDYTVDVVVTSRPDAGASSIRCYGAGAATAAQQAKRLEGRGAGAVPAGTAVVSDPRSRLPIFRY